MISTAMLDEELMGQIDDRIARLLPASSRADPLYGMIKYHLGWVDDRLQPVRNDPGKRIRSRLCLLSCMAAGSPPERALAPATAIELVHNFSLVHDDIQDRSRYRRYRRTVWDLWGEAQAINAGDGLFTLAQLALADDPEASPWVIMRAFRALNGACRSLCEGQFLDLDFETRPTVTVEDYFAMIEHKTGALLATSCLLGALYGGAPEPALDEYYNFGRHLGLAFQIRDDYLGIWGDPKDTGKPSADDLTSKKKTLPILYALAASAGDDRARLESFLAAGGPAEETEAAAILAILDRCGADSYTTQGVERESRNAIDALSRAQPVPEAAAALTHLCEMLSLRTR